MKSRERHLERQDGIYVWEEQRKVAAMLGDKLYEIKDLERQSRELHQLRGNAARNKRKVSRRIMHGYIIKHLDITCSVTICLISNSFWIKDVGLEHA